jgi:hypothetical protein
VNGARLEVVEPAAHGTATVDRSVVVYTPARDYAGPDTFAYRWIGRDGGSSDTMRVTLNVIAAPPRPAAPRFILVPGRLRLDRRGRVTVAGTCDRACTLTLRVRIKLHTGRVIEGRTVRANAGAGGAVKLRLRRGKLPARRKVAWARVSGQATGADGRTRAVLLKLR